MSLVEDKCLKITARLKKEHANLSLLEERLGKSGQIAKDIDNILNSFEERLSRLEHTILPVYNETEKLQNIQHSIDRTLQLLDNVICFYNVSSDVEEVIERGPGDQQSDLDEYLESLNRLASAQKYFEKHIPQSVELENVSTLYQKGSDKLNMEFKSILDKNSSAVMPIVLLDLINLEDCNKLPIDTPEAFKNSLVVIANWLLNNGRDEYLTVYGKVRGAVLMRSLNMLRNHQKSGSSGSTQGVMSSPMFKSKFQNRMEASRKPSTRRLHQAFERKANKMLMRASQTLENSTGFTLGGRKSSNHLDASYNGDEIDTEREMENYLVCVMALHKLMQIEQLLMKDIVAQAHLPRIFELIVREAMDTIVHDGENMVLRAKKFIGRHDFGTVLVVFPILKQMLSLKPEFEKTVEGCDLNIKVKFDSILTMLQSTGSKALEDFIDSLRSDSIAQLPSDGTVHELTSNVIMYLEQLVDYADIIGVVLSNDIAYAKQAEKLKGSSVEKIILGLYVKRVLVQLNSCLLSKSEQYNDPALKAIFRLNNNNYILKSLQRSNLLELYLISEPNCEQYYYTSIQDHKKLYSAGWNKLLHYIVPPDGELLQGDKLRDKGRTLIKEKFAGFNKEIEEISKVQRGYSIPDVELRESIKRDNKELVIPRYHAFYTTYITVGFTKNPSKYIKYKPDEVSTIIDRLFDVAA